MQGNPFAAVLKKADAPPVTVDAPVPIELVEPQPIEDVNCRLPRPESKGLLFYDLETVPDEARFPRPVPPAERSAPPIDQKTANLRVEELKPLIETMQPAQLDQLEAIEKAREDDPKKKVRATVLNAIKEARKAGDKEMEAWKKEGSTNPFLCRIVAMGYAVGDRKVESIVATTDQQERNLLEEFWRLVAQNRMRVGYNITGFDDLVVIVRSAILGVEPSKRLDRRKFGNREAYDLMHAIFPSSTAKKLKDVCGWLGISPPAGEMDGSQVFDLWENREFGTIADYVKSDVIVERDLYWTLSPFMAN